jgi:hypothetical protein
MSEDETKTLDINGRLNRVQETLNALTAHVTTVGAKIDQQTYQTKPMWEKALAELEEVNRNLGKLDRKIDIFNSDLLDVRADQRGHEQSIKHLESAGETRSQL